MYVSYEFIWGHRKLYESRPQERDIIFLYVSISRLNPITPQSPT